jgi:hypothetical protein
VPVGVLCSTQQRSNASTATTPLRLLFKKISFPWQEDFSRPPHPVLPPYGCSSHDDFTFKVLDTFMDSLLPFREGAGSRVVGGGVCGAGTRALLQERTTKRQWWQPGCALAAPWLRPGCALAVGAPREGGCMALPMLASQRLLGTFVCGVLV